MGIPDMFGLRSVQSKIPYGVIAGIAVYVVDDLARFKITTDILLHNVTMLKDVLQSSLFFLICWIWVIVGRCDKGIPVFSYPAAALPVGGKLPAFTIHRVSFSNHALAIHRIFIAAYIPVIGWVGIGKVAGGHGATVRTILFIGGWELPEVVTALGAGHELAFSFKFPGAFTRTKTQFNTGEGIVNLFTVFTRSLYHALNYTLYRTVMQCK